MKTFIVESLNSGVKSTAARLFAVISAMVHDNTLRGLAPKDQQVVDVVKNWRRYNPKKSVAPMIEICNGHLYDLQYMQSLAEDDILILCETQPSVRPGSSDNVSCLGDGSDAFPIRVKTTCHRLNRAYIAVQSRSDCTTMLHLDSTHNMVIHGYSVFAFGYSDQSCHFILLVYFCTSQKRQLDVMMGTDKAQFNASVTELPYSTV
ncbi:hypothetical protein PF010_g361 [Phytophthora fragariae]|uniref:Uncharacterized protein n=1 Tax=Phytophthora fragariae TaxID=53985 RepID=A0A6A3FV60_9STRA|nr:hypothetical protein PF003_g9798 [Phytophthora fragariae]KAE8950095.1 hypothetical protein PF009_g372 [Phytophthora fragariae]KAE9139441.1 hypothetical protein PF007_g1028 [Phytophthora fragariae]KAE9139976.1 hypothetical protein PF010_g361 [Phytophthora fragariae]KAE9155851.1 hypothetical protein PF006_g263 [Phytophthora fragariae]